MRKVILAFTLLLWCLSSPLIFSRESSAQAFSPSWSWQPSTRSSDPPTNPPPLVPGSEIRFEHYSADQGLSMSVVLSITQDRYGFMWFATQDGLNRFDGKNFQVFKHDPDDPNSLSANWIESVYADSTGILWIGTEAGGLDRYNPVEDTFSQYRHIPGDENSLSDNTIFEIYEDRTGNLWVGTAKGLDLLNRRTGRVQRILPAADIPEFSEETIVYSIFQNHSGDYWIGTRRGLFKFDWMGNQLKPIPYTLDPASEPTEKELTHPATEILEDHNGRLWIGTSGGGLYLLDEESQSLKPFAIVTQPEKPLENFKKITALLEDPFHRILIGTWGEGVVYLDPVSGMAVQYLSEIGNPNSLSSNHILDFYQDHSGSIWVGTFGGGLSKLDLASLRFTHYRNRSYSSNSLISRIVWSVFEEDGILWVGTDSGLDRIDRATGLVAHYQHQEDNPNSLPSNNVQALFRDHYGFLWIGTNDGLSRLDASLEEFRNFTADMDDPESLKSAYISSIIEDQSGDLWIGTKNGLSKFVRETEKFETFGSDPDDPGTLNSASVNIISPSADGNLWVGTNTGLNSFNPRTGQAARHFFHHNDSQEVEDFNILAIFEDEQRSLWLGTVGSGLLRYQPDAGVLERFTEKDGLPNDTVYGILQDDAGFLWMSTNNGLGRFDPKTRTFEKFEAKDGLQGNEFNSFAYFKNQSGELFFGGINGLSIFQPAEIQSNKYVPPVVLTAFTINGQTEKYPDQPISLEKITLKWPENSFEFEFSALSFVQPEQNQYAYFLENFDKDWNLIDTKSYGRYTNLPGGHYVLRLKASNNDGVWNQEGRAIKVEVVPPFWQTLWFRLGLGLIGVLLVFGGYRLRVNNVVNRSRQLEAQVRERTQEIEQRRQVLEALYRADEALYRNLQLDHVLQALVESAVSLLKADKGSLLVLDKATGTLSAQITIGFKPETVEEMQFELGEGIAGIVAQTGQPYLVEDTQNEPLASRRIVEAEGIRSIMQVPIKVADEVFGVFSADFLQPNSFGEEDLRMLISLAQRAAQAIQNAQLYNETQEKAVAEERNRLARELHDAVTQTLFSASLIAEALPTAFDSDPEEGRELLNELRQLNRGALAEMRALLMELRPSALEEANLEDLLRQLGEAAAGREGIPVTVLTNGHQNLPPDVHIALYRIAQEALNNALKHARASHISIDLKPLHSVAGNLQNDHPDGIQLTISDDGRGFDPLHTPSDHLGLKIMRERAHAIGADLTIQSKLGKGTRVDILWENYQYN